MDKETKTLKYSFASSVGAGMKSIFKGSKKTFYILEHKIGSKYHRTDEQQHIIVDQIEIGRDHTCHVRFDELFETVSRHHAAIVRDDNRLKLIPLSQKNPTLLNGSKIADEHYLQHGDVIQCAINGPKLRVIIPSGRHAMTDSISLKRRFYLFGKQVVEPFQKTFVMIICVIFILLCVVGIYIFIK
ncbi:MAG: FHA domain-containing protein [Tannerella sp.]|jgi:pSer/pThr/pTyr-binding forkhead associated (FHA) protein|nr:FHA domain-containing protein [Tannerella sp.]